MSWWQSPGLILLLTAALLPLIAPRLRDGLALGAGLAALLLCWFFPQEGRRRDWWRAQGEKKAGHRRGAPESLLARS